MSMQQSAEHPGAMHRGGNASLTWRGQQALDEWVVGLSARLVFAATLIVYYLGSAATKLGDGLFGLFPPSAGAFAQILPPIAEHYSYDVAAIPFFPWHIVVMAGTVAEFVLPILIVLGLLTRLAALGMTGFIIVQTIVDIAFHGAAAGMLFNNQPGELLDTRLLWLFVLAVLIAKGAGTLSLDALIFRKRGPK